MMNQNSFFSWPRFAKYGSGRFKLHLPQMLLWAGVAFIVLVGYFLFYFNAVAGIWPVKNWIFYLALSTIIAGALFAGTSFPEFRSKLGTQSFLMIPVSNFEKLSYEFLERIVLFSLVFPIIAVAAGYLGVFVSDVIASARGLQWDLSYPHDFFKSVEFWEQKSSNHNNALNNLILTDFTFWLVSFFFFACTLVFRRNALIKSIILDALISAVYGFLMFQNKLSQGASYVDFTISGMHWSSCLIILVGTLLFAYFKLKEKEVK